MATEVHPATVGFSVRNYLVMAGPSTQEAITAGLKKVWDDRVEDAEVESALVELETRAMVALTDEGAFRASDQRFFRHRPRLPAETRPDDPRAWEGWS